jgi:alpha-glucosidase
MTPWWRGAVIYQIYPRSFRDCSGDGVGDLPGILEKLEHVASLGVDAIWLSPIFPSPMEDMGYDVRDYTDVDPLFGSLADFDQLLEQAHRLGLKVIIDQVLSHTSSQHPWFQESQTSREHPRADWYVWAEPKADGGPPNNWLSVFGGSAWEWSPLRRQYYLHNFLASQPDLNFHQEAVQEALLEAMRFWLDRGVDGFRLDTVNYYFHDPLLRDNPPQTSGGSGSTVNPYDMQEHRYSKNQPENLAFLERMRSLLDGYEDRMLVGEIGDLAEPSLRLMADYTRGESRLHMAYSFQMLRPVFSAEHFRSTIEQCRAYAADGWPCWSFSNHDVVRHVSRWQPHGTERTALARLTAAMLASFRGSLGLYQGEELGLPEAELRFEELTDPPGIRFWPEYKGRDGCRTPMPWKATAPGHGFSGATPWLPIKPEQARLNVESQEKDPESILNFYRDLLAFRKAQPELQEGEIRFLEASEPLLALERRHQERALIGLFNLAPTPITVELSAPGSPEGPAQHVELQESTVSLGPNGFVFVRPASFITAVQVLTGR